MADIGHSPRPLAFEDPGGSLDLYQAFFELVVGCVAEILRDHLFQTRAKRAHVSNRIEQAFACL